MLRSISQHRLHRRSLELADERIESASLFPLFDRDGTTRALMLTREDSSEIRLAEWRPGLFEWRWLRPLRLSLRRDELAAGTEDLPLDALWHFDPWWELGAGRYAGNPKAPPLQETNLPGHDDSLTRVWFDSRLHRITWVASGRGESMTLGRFSPSRLHAAEASRRRSAGSAESAERDRSGWRLRPFWS